MIKLIMFASAVMAGCGVYGLLTRRNLAFVILSLELVLNAGILFLVALMPAFSQKSLVISSALILLAIGAAEIAFGFALAVALARKHSTSDILKLSELGGKFER